MVCPVRVVYPSYEEGEGGKKSHVLIVSYAWVSDALAIAAMGPESEALLNARVICFNNKKYRWDRVSGRPMG